MQQEHCLACHKSFDPHTNAKTSCFVEHEMTEYYGRGRSCKSCGDKDDNCLSGCNVCNTQFCDLNGWPKRKQQCYKGPHITEQEDLERAERPEPAAQKMKLLKNKIIDTVDYRT